MIYKSCSIDEVIARIIRNTRITDVSYIVDMQEWIPEAMGMMKTQYQLFPAYKDIIIDYHKGKLPCDLVSLIAVEYNGERLSFSSTVKHHETSQTSYKNTSNTSVFLSQVVAELNPSNKEENTILWKPTLSSTETLNQVQCLPLSDHWYQTEMNWINTSICDGEVRLYYYATPVDENGLPLIPDNEDYKQALYYYVRAMMLGSGYEDKMFNYEQLMQHFNLHAARAINQIRYPSVDMKEEQIKHQVNFNLPEYYWETWFK